MNPVGVAVAVVAVVGVDVRVSAAVADGVKSEQQEAFLTRHNCLYGQGPYYSAAIEADQVAAKMAESGGQATRRRRLTRKRAGAKAG